MADVAPKKKLPFKATALRRAQAPAQEKEEEEDELELFRQSRKMAPILAAQQERNMRRRRKHALAEELERSPPPKDEETTLSPKRKRQESSPTKVTPKKTRVATPEDDAPIAIDLESPTRITQDTPIAVDEGQGAKTTTGSEDATPIAIDSESESGLLEEAFEDEKNSEDEEEEFSEYVRKAERQRSQLDAKQRSATVDIMITCSCIPGAAPSYIRYQLDRPLQLVRDSWVAVQRRKGVAVPEGEQLVLTWRRSRVYARSSLLSVGVPPPQDPEDKVRVHLEAWTAEALAAEERRLKDDEACFEEERGQDVGAKMTVTLKAREREDVEVEVTPRTTVETLVNAFRRRKGVASDKDVGVVFDGQRLEEHETMEDAGVEHMDCLEVHVR